jgi:hypothetical protein
MIASSSAWKRHLKPELKAIRSESRSVLTTLAVQPL